MTKTYRSFDEVNLDFDKMLPKNRKVLFRTNEHPS